MGPDQGDPAQPVDPGSAPGRRSARPGGGWLARLPTPKALVYGTLTLAATVAAGVLVTGGAATTPTATLTATPTASAAATAAALVTDPLTKGIAALQDTLRREPADAQSWAALGQAYLQQARLTADPSYYAKAATALDTSLRLQPVGNGAALLGQATLAAGQHEFARALALADQAISLNPYSASAYAIKGDALTELGRYDQARGAVQKLLSLQPGVDAFARASYQYELRGQVDQARYAMQQALEATTARADQAFARHYLGELAFSQGDSATALREDDAALVLDPAYVPAIAGRARTLAATGDTAGALAGYREAVRRQPQPAFVIALAELLAADGQQGAATEEFAVVRATEQLFAAQGSNVDLELALFEADHGTPADALRYAASAYAARPAAILVQDAYAWALHRAGRDAEALPIARQALSLGLDPAAMRFHLGVIEAALGDRPAARRDLTAALTRCPRWNPLQVPVARQLLADLSH